MFFKKQKEIDSVKVIALKSPERGLGTTHISLCIANTLATMGKRVAVIEWNGHNDFAEIERTFRGFGYEARNSDFFRIRRVDYYKSYQQKGLAELKKGKYDLIIADIGTHQNPYFAEADIPILVISGSEWKAGKLLPTVKEYEDKVGSRLKVFLNFGTAEEISFFQKRSRAGFYAFPFWKDVFSSKKEQRNQVLQMVL